MKRKASWYIFTVLKLFIWTISYFILLGIVTPRLLSAPSTISFFGGIVIIVILVALLLWRIYKFLSKLKHTLEVMDNQDVI